jgi:hypothetical protein
MASSGRRAIWAGAPADSATACKPMAKKWSMAWLESLLTTEKGIGCVWLGTTETATTSNRFHRVNDLGRAVQAAGGRY